MIQSKHCDLCQHEKRSLKNGLTCKLTNRKPEFRNTCSEIKLNEKFQEKLELAILELQIIRRNKESTHLLFYFLIAIGFFLIIKSGTLAKLTLITIYFWIYKIGIIAVGITVISISFNELRKQREKIKNAEIDKNKIDLIIEKYGISYKSNLDFKENIHGTQDVNVELEFKNWTKKRTTTKYKINALSQC